MIRCPTNFGAFVRGAVPHLGLQSSTRMTPRERELEAEMLNELNSKHSQLLEKRVGKVFVRERRSSMSSPINRNIFFLFIFIENHFDLPSWRSTSGCTPPPGVPPCIVRPAASSSGARAAQPDTSGPTPPPRSDPVHYATAIH